MSLRRIVWNEELLAVLAALCSPSWVSIGLLSIPILRPKKLSIITTVETLQDCRDWWDPWDLDYPQGLQNIVDLICGRLALAILVTFFLLVKVPKWLLANSHEVGVDVEGGRSMVVVRVVGGDQVVLVPTRPNLTTLPHQTSSKVDLSTLNFWQKKLFNADQTINPFQISVCLYVTISSRCRHFWILE